MALDHHSGFVRRGWIRGISEITPRRNIGIRGVKSVPRQTSYLDGRFGELLANRPRRRRDKPALVVKSVDHGESHSRDGMGRYSAIPALVGALRFFRPLVHRIAGIQVRGLVLSTLSRGI